MTFSNVGEVGHPVLHIPSDSLHTLHKIYTAAFF